MQKNRKNTSCLYVFKLKDAVVRAIIFTVFLYGVMYCICVYAGANRSTILARQELGDAQSTDFTLVATITFQKSVEFILHTA
jgi:hypothetical protein